MDHEVEQTRFQGTMCTRTLGEVNCRVLHAEDEDALRRAVKSGLAFPPIRVKQREAFDGKDDASTSVGSGSEGLEELRIPKIPVSFFRIPWLGFENERKEPLPRRSPLSWHSRLPLLATRGGDQDVVVHDMRECRKTGEAPPTVLLSNEFQTGIRDVAWRPCSGKQIAVACQSGLCIWKFGKAPVPGFPGFVQTKEDPEAAWVIFIDTERPTSCLSWSPDGKRLAAAHDDSPVLYLWNVSTRSSTPLQSSFRDKILMLRWSPCGKYLWVGCANGTFFLWDTFSWTHKKWSNPSSRILDASWGPDGQSLVVCLYGKIPMIVLYLSGKPGSCLAHVLPLEIPALVEESGTCSTTCLAEAVAWDNTGERLLILMGKDHSRAGEIAIYSAKTTPVLNLGLIGYLAPQKLSDIRQIERGALAFLPFCSSGALAAHSCNGLLDIFPLIFQS